MITDNPLIAKDVSITRSPGSPLQCGQLAGSSLESSFKFVRDAVSSAELQQSALCPFRDLSNQVNKVSFALNGWLLLLYYYYRP